MTKQPWVDSEIVRLRALAKTHTLHEAGNLLGRSRGSVSMKAHELGIRFAKYGEAHRNSRHANAKIKEIVRLQSAGWRNVQIARHLGIGQSYVSQVVNYELRFRETLPLVLGEAMQP